MAKAASALKQTFDGSTTTMGRFYKLRLVCCPIKSPDRAAKLDVHTKYFALDVFIRAKLGGLADNFA